jgi:hypothetical protein
MRLLRLIARLLVYWMVNANDTSTATRLLKFDHWEINLDSQLDATFRKANK